MLLTVILTAASGTGRGCIIPALPRLVYRIWSDPEKLHRAIWIKWIQFIDNYSGLWYAFHANILSLEFTSPKARRERGHSNIPAGICQSGFNRCQRTHVPDNEQDQRSICLPLSLIGRHRRWFLCFEDFPFARYFFISASQGRHMPESDNTVP